MDIEERLSNLERANKGDERLTSIERMSIRFTAFLLLELALFGLIVWSLFHLIHFIRSSAF